MRDLKVYSSCGISRKGNVRMLFYYGEMGALLYAKSYIFLPNSKCLLCI